MAATKTKKKQWGFTTIQSRQLAEELTKMSANKVTIFSVYPSMIAGSFDVLYYAEVVDGE